MLAKLIEIELLTFEKTRQLKGRWQKYTKRQLYQVGFAKKKIRLLKSRLM